MNSLTDVILPELVLVIVACGLFLLGKSTHEIHNALEGEEGEKSKRIAPSFTSVLIQILLLDIVFFTSIRHQLLFPTGQKELAKIIYTHK